VEALVFLENPLDNKERAQQIYDAWEDEYCLQKHLYEHRALAAAIRAVADRFATDWGELQHPYDVLNEIANELENLND
jgi:hypothetical protein